MNRSTNPTIHKVIVLGGGSAGLLSALTLKRLLPELDVTIIHSPEIGVIGVGEGTTALFPEHLFNTLQIPKERFYREAEPTWKQGIRFLWGERGDYFYDFGFQYDLQFPGTSHATGYYATDNCDDLNETCALMRQGKAFKLGPLGKPIIRGQYAFHIENAKLVSCLENIARESGVTIIEDTLASAEADGGNITRLHFTSGASHHADLFIDASGFRAELIGRTLAEPFIPFSDGLFCDRAIIGGWERQDEHLQAYTTAETMNAGWCWQIEHEHYINRGYVYGSNFVSDDEAAAEFVANNPKIKSPRLVRFRSGRHRRNWVGNVVAIGNASGFVEPLEATALAQIIYASGWLVDSLKRGEFSPDESIRETYNLQMARAWDEIRDFLAFHYKFNTLRDTPFWKHCQTETSLGDFTALYEAYTKLGPGPQLIEALPFRPNIYGIEGYLAHLVGMRVPYQGRPAILPQEQENFERHRARIRSSIAASTTCTETLTAIRSETWSF